MTAILVSPLARIAEIAVRHGAHEMISLMAKEQNFHRPAVIRADRHLLLTMNDISFAGTGDLVAPQETHVRDRKSTRLNSSHITISLSDGIEARLCSSIAGWASPARRRRL